LPLQFSSIFGQVNSRFPRKSAAELVDQDGFISVDCEFCSRIFPLSLSDLDG
jgi:redox-regulated HSP33 family molecular chaperone